MPSNKSRRPPLIRALAPYLAVLVLLAIAARIMHPLVLIPLLLANTLAMATMCHAIGFAPEASVTRTVIRRGAAWLVLFTAYTALVWLLVALPMILLATAPTPGHSLLLALALVVAMLCLWRAWPAFGLVFLWDDAFPQSGSQSWIFTALTRSFAFASHVAVEGRKISGFLPCALCTLALAVGALALSGTYAIVPAELRAAALWGYGVVLLPLCCLVIADRTLRAMLRERRGQAATAGTAPESAASQTSASAARIADAPGAPDPASAPPAPMHALVDAVRAGDAAHVEELLEAGVDANDADQRTALSIAALCPDTRMLRALIAHGADVNTVHQGATALIVACRDGGMPCAQAVVILLANGADASICDGEGNTALHHAVHIPDPSVAAGLVDAGADPNATNHRGLGALAVACAAANWRVAEWLLQHGAKINPDAGEPAIVAAAGTVDDDPAGLALLLKYKARVDARSARGRTALMTAAQGGHLRAVQCLLDAHANPDLADEHGTTALMEAAREGANDIVDALLNAGANPMLQDRHGRDALALVCQSPRATVATARLLLDAGVDPRTGADEGLSALDYAADAGRDDLVDLFDRGATIPTSAPVDIPDRQTATPEHLLDALRFGHWSVVNELTAQVASWPPAVLADAFVELVEPGQSRARDWLLVHGLAAGASCVDGRPLFAVLVERLPDTVAALAAYMDAGASPAGAGGLAHVMQSLLDAPDTGVPLASRMLDAGADPFGPLDDGRTPLHLATAPGWLAILQHLVDAGVDPNACDRQGSTPLHAALACATPTVEAVRALVAAGADPELGQTNGETPLGLAMDMDRPDLQAWLRWPSWSPPHRRLRGEDMPEAARAGDGAAIAKLLQLGFAVDTPDARGASALIYACGGGHQAIALQLLEAGADPGQVTTSGISPLVAAVNGHRLDMIGLLTTHGAEVDQRLPGGLTALSIACGQGHADMVKALVEAGANVNAADEQGRSPLGIAAHYGFASRDSLRCRRMLDALLEAGADPNHVDAAGLTPLLTLLGAHAKPGADCDATHLGALVPALLDAGARHDHADPRGITALHACAMHALLAPARILLASGANRTAVDAFERCGADVARQLGYMDVALELDTRPRTIPGVQQTLRTPARSPD